MMQGGRFVLRQAPGASEEGQESSDVSAAGVGLLSLIASEAEADLRIDRPLFSQVRIKV